ncbi:MAG: GNAT family N-acetyltransferase [Pseudomonadota bacterium]
MVEISVIRADPRDLQVDAVIARHLDLMRSVSPPESVFAQDAAGLVRDGARLFVAQERAGPLLGIGAYKMIAPTHAELKSMHVVAEARGRGVGGRLLQTILEAATQEGARRLSLETGRAEAFAPALRLYRTAGFTECDAFAGYVANPFSTFLTMEIGASPA